jgi:hypothetical protein
MLETTTASVAAEDVPTAFIVDRQAACALVVGRDELSADRIDVDVDLDLGVRLERRCGARACHLVHTAPPPLVLEG